MTREVPARILVVDDQRLHRDKLVLAVRALGHEAEAVDGGARALARLAAEPFDLVLLDILMPEVDGFEVMSVMQRDRRLREVPVIVVSALESEMDSVVRAVEMGAEDVLPKRFDAVLLAARLDSALERRRARAHEQEHRRQMHRLSDAAAVLERHALAPESLNLESVCERDDAIGRLARVFVQMVREAHRRRVRLHRQLAALRTTGLALAVGFVLGLALPLARTALVDEPHPFGIALWVSGLCALLCLPSVLWRPRLPRAGVALLRFVVALAAAGVLAGVLPLLWLARELPASVLATVLPAEVAIALALSSLLAGRWPPARRLVALALAAGGVLALLAGPGAATLGWRPDTLLVALIAPLGWALAARLVARTAANTRPDGTELVGASRVDALALVGLVALVACLCLAPLAIALDDLVPLFVPETGRAPGTGIGLVIVLLGAVLAAGGTLRIVLAREGGAEAAAASSLATALGALAWSVLVLGERIPAGVWLPLALAGAALALRATAALGREPPLAPTLDVELD